MLAKLLTSTLLASAFGDEITAMLQNTSILELHNFSIREAIAEHRAELAEARSHVEIGADAEAVQLKIRVMDGALEYEDNISQLESLASKLHDGVYEVFPMGDAVTAIAEETVVEEIRHQRTGETLMLRLEEQPADVDRQLLKILVEEWLGDGDFDPSAMRDVRLETADSTQVDDLGTQASEGIRDHRWLFEFLEAKLAKAHAGRYQHLSRFQDLKSIVEESMEEELHHQKLHEVLLQKLEALPGGTSLRERLAKHAVLTVLDSDVANATEVADHGPPDGDDAWDALYSGDQGVETLQTV